MPRNLITKEATKYTLQWYINNHLKNPKTLSRDIEKALGISNMSFIFWKKSKMVKRSIKELAIICGFLDITVEDVNNNYLEFDRTKEVRVYNRS